MAEYVTGVTVSEWRTMQDALANAEKKLKQPASGATVIEAVTGLTSGGVPTHAPSVRRGESAVTSRPFSFTKSMGLISGAVKPDKARVEVEVLRAFQTALEETNSMPSGVSGTMFLGQQDYLPDEASHHKATIELRRAMSGGGETDRDELAWISRNDKIPMDIRRSAMSYLTDTIGGTLVAPAQMGELIPLMRNTLAVSQAGAQQVPLPPQGKWVAPRITGPSTGYWVQEGQEITESNPTTGEVSMMAKKLGVLIRINNELFRYASPAVDQMLKSDAAKTFALGFDYACLYGVGGAGQPKGLDKYTGTNEVYSYAAGTTPTPSGIGANGNTLQPQDGFLMAGVIEDRNFPLEGWAWIMRPRMKAAILSRRADAVTAGDASGQFVQSQFRTTADGLTTNWDGYRIAASSQVTNTLTKGSGTSLTQVWGGCWSEFLMGMYGAVEFAANAMGEATFKQDQTLVRGILHCDAVPRYPGAFTYYTQLLMQ